MSSSLPFIGSDAIRDVVGQYDTLLAVGIPLFRVVFPSRAEYVPQSLKVIQIDLDSWELGKNLSNVLSIKADPHAALTALIQQLEGRRPSGAEERANDIAADRETRAATQREADRKGWDDVPIAVPRLMSELTGMLPEDVAVFDESVTSEPVLARYLKVKKDNYFRARSGGLGPGMPGAVGLKLARPNQSVVGHRRGWLGDVLDHGAVDGGSSQGARDLGDLQQRQLPDSQAQPDGVPRARERSTVHAHGYRGSRDSLRQARRVAGRQRLASREARRAPPAWRQRYHWMHRRWWMSASRDELGSRNARPGTAASARPPV